MRLFWQLLRSYWQSLLLALAIGSVSGIGSIALIAIIHRVLKEGQDHARLSLAALFAGLCLIVLLTRVVSQILITRVAQGAISRLRLGLCRRILETPLRQLEEIGEHRMLACLTGDVTVISLAANGVPVACVNGVILLCGAAYLAWLSPGLLAGALAITVLGVVSYRASSALAGRYLREAREAQDDLLDQIRSMIRGVKELKLHDRRRAEFVEQLLTGADTEVRTNQTIGYSLQGAAVSWGRLMFFLAIGLLLFVWPTVVRDDPATLAGYTLTILYLMTPLERIMAWIPLFERAVISTNKIRRLGLQLDSVEPEAALPQVESPVSWERITLEGVTHSYRRAADEQAFQLGPIDLTIEPGEIVFLTGGNGSGKTTLAKLIAGLYLPEQGQVRWDGRVVDPERRAAYRQLFSAVFDRAVVFPRLLGMDPRLAAGELDQQAQEYLRQLELDHVVEITAGNFSTTQLSRGQQKRLALLTAYLEDRPIYLFDEWAADQDPGFKRIFYERCLPELRERGKTVLAITHDDRYFRCADRIVKLEEGQLAVESWEAVSEQLRTNG